VGQQRHLQERGLLTAESAAERRRAAALAGHTTDPSRARELLSDPDPNVRATALAALARAGAASEADVTAGLADPEPVARKRACEVAATTRLGGGALLALLTDADDGVVEIAAWAAGELELVSAVDSLARITVEHGDALAREAAVAALGAIGDPAGLPAILAAINDKPAVRRRAVLALAPFEGPEVDAALEKTSRDRDWQVRDAAEMLRR
jgi:HEAT repeat protein